LDSKQTSQVYIPKHRVQTSKSPGITGKLPIIPGLLTQLIPYLTI